MKLCLREDIAERISGLHVCKAYNCYNSETGDNVVMKVMAPIARFGGSSLLADLMWLDSTILDVGPKGERRRAHKVGTFLGHDALKCVGNKILIGDILRMLTS